MKRFNQRKGTPLPGLRFSRAGPSFPDAEPPTVRSVAGRVEGSRIVLTWEAGGGEAAGYVVELLGDGAQPVRRTELPPGQRRFRDEPLDALVGARTYRVLAIGRDGTVAGREEKVPFRMDFELSFLGVTDEDLGLFRVAWDREGGTVKGTFEVPIGGEIGGGIAAADDRPALDLGTGWTFAGIAGRRTVVPGEVEVPRFSPNGLLEKDPETGKVVFETREGPTTSVETGAEVVPAGEGGGRTRWYPKAKD